MKRLVIPEYDDVAIITALSENRRLNRTSYPHLRDNLETVINGYSRYMVNNGDAWGISVDLIPTELKDGLLTNYDTPPVQLNHLDILRNSSRNVCPMCGSERAVNLDHILTKEKHPQWAVYSKNLVPGCNCNIKRKSSLTGDIATRQRVLHPYFDDCLIDRLLSCTIDPDADFRLADIEIRYLCEDSPDYESIKYHVEKVVLRSGLVGWLGSQWSQLRRSPPDLIQTIPYAHIDSVESMLSYLNDSLGRHDSRAGTPNNWNSIFIHGIVNTPNFIEQLVERHNRIVAGDIEVVDN
jgi:hypothetical protein